jgi:hypothetical protein
MLSAFLNDELRGNDHLNLFHELAIRKAVHPVKVNEMPVPRFAHLIQMVAGTIGHCPNLEHDLRTPGKIRAQFFGQFRGTRREDANSAASLSARLILKRARYNFGE